jgi:hypothetical protein
MKMTDKKTEQQLPPDQQLPPTALQQAEQLAALQKQLDALTRGQKNKALAAALRNWGK